MNYFWWIENICGMVREIKFAYWYQGKLKPNCEYSLKVSTRFPQKLYWMFIGVSSIVLLEYELNKSNESFLSILNNNTRHAKSTPESEHISSMKLREVSSSLQQINQHNYTVDFEIKTMNYVFEILQLFLSLATFSYNLQASKAFFSICSWYAFVLCYVYLILPS